MGAEKGRVMGRERIPVGVSENCLCPPKAEVGRRKGSISQGGDFSGK